MEALYLKLSYKVLTANFISCYKTPSLHNKDFIDFLYAKISGIDWSRLFFIEDLNMDLNSTNGLDTFKESKLISHS